MKVENYAGISSAVLFGIFSTSLAFLNKAVLSSYHFDLPFFIMACQMVVSIAFIETYRLCSPTFLPKYSFQRGYSMLMPSFFYAAHCITSLYALSGMSIPMYAAVKRCSPIIILFLSSVMLQNGIPRCSIITSVILITVGCIMAGIGDIELDAKAYSYGSVSVIVQAIYLTLIQRSSENMTVIEILQVNSFNTLPFFVLFSWVFDGYEVMYKQKQIPTDVGFFACFIVQLIVGVALNFSQFACTTFNSALTTSLVGVAKSMIQTVIGSFTFGGIVFNALNVSGIVINIVGSVLYVIEKYREKIRFISKRDSLLNGSSV